MLDNVHGTITLYGTVFQLILLLSHLNNSSWNYNSHFLQWDFKFKLIPLHSPLLRESQLVYFPPLINMLKFSGFSDMIWDECRGCWKTFWIVVIQIIVFNRSYQIWNVTMYEKIILKHVYPSRDRCNMRSKIWWFTTNAINITFHISLCSSSAQYPRDPLSKVVQMFKMWYKIVKYKSFQ